MKITLLLTLLLLTLTACNPQNSSTDQTMPEPTHMSEDPSNDMKMATLEMPEETSSESFAATYEAFDQATFDAALGQDRLVLFFFADWCGTCQQWEKHIQENFDDLNEAVVIYKANFDTESDLREVFGITSQSTAVFLEPSGSVAKIEADPSIASLNAFFAE